MVRFLLQVGLEVDQVLLLGSVAPVAVEEAVILPPTLRHNQHGLLRELHLVRLGQDPNVLVADALYRAG